MVILDFFNSIYFFCITASSKRNTFNWSTDEIMPESGNTDINMGVALTLIGLKIGEYTMKIMI